MKLNFRQAALPLILFILPVFFFNCSVPPGSPVARPGTQTNGDGVPNLNPVSPGFEVLPNNSIVVKQNRELKYSPTNGASGTYTISGLPSWATFNSSTGTIQGIPNRLSDSAVITISQGTSSYGPYQISILGDALVEQQWHLFNTGQNGFALTAAIAGQDLQLRRSVAEGILGSGVRIAISDTGTIIDHPDLSPNILFGEARNYALPFNGSVSSWLGNPSPDITEPSDAHGTAVAGLAAAKGWNQVGGRGVAPEARIAPFLFLQAQLQLLLTNAQEIAFLDQFAGTNIDVFNYSWGDPQCSLTSYDQNFYDKLYREIRNTRGGLGAIYLMAAGNSFVEALENCDQTASPGDYVLGNTNFSELNTTPFIINVSALNSNGVVASYATPGSANWISGYGGEYGWSIANPSSSRSSMPALTTTDFLGCDRGLKFLFADVSAFNSGVAPNQDCHYSSTMNGTSAATPLVAGAVALMLQANPRLTWRDVKYILAKTADVVDPNVNPQNHPAAGMSLAGHSYDLPWVTNSAGFKFHNYYGFGRLNVDNAVDMSKTFSSTWGPLLITPFRSETVSVAIPDASATGITRTLNVMDSFSLEAVQLRISISACPGDVGIELTSPSGTRSKLMNINSMLADGNMSSHILLSNAFFGESSLGTWTLKVVDGRSPCSANLTAWGLRFFGH